MKTLYSRPLASMLLEGESLEEYNQQTAVLFGIELTRLRQLKRMSLQDIYDRTHIARSTFNGYEKGGRIPDQEKPRAIAKALEMTYRELLNILHDCQATALVRVDDRIPPESREQVIDYINYAKERGMQKAAEDAKRNNE